MSALKDRFFILSLLGFLFLNLTWGILLPVHEGPDEQNHYYYIVFLRDQRRLPVQYSKNPDVIGEGEHAPLYYAVLALALKLFDPTAPKLFLPFSQNFKFNVRPAWFQHPNEPKPLVFDVASRGPHLMRVIQVIFPLGSLSCLWLFLSSLAIGVVARRLSFLLLAFNPGFVFFSSVINCDHASTLFFSLSLLCMVDAAQQGSWAWGHSFWSGLFLGLGALSKVTPICLLPLAALVAWRYGDSSKILGMLVLAFAIAFWFYWRNELLYGEFFNYKLDAETYLQCVHVKSPWDMRWWLFWSIRNLESFWMVFGWLAWMAPRLWELFFLSLGLAAFYGLLKSPGDDGAWILLGAFFLLLIGIMRFNLEFDPPEGRYFFPGLLCFGGFFGFGFDALLPRGAKLLPLLLGGTLLILNTWLLMERLPQLYYGV